jgi:hypothetical protein
VLGLIEKTVQATALPRHTHDLTVLELDDTVDEVLRRTLCTPAVLTVRIGILGRHEVPTVDADFHTITYR